VSAENVLPRIAALLLILGSPLAAHPVTVKNWSAVPWYLSVPAEGGTTGKVELGPGRGLEPAQFTLEVKDPGVHRWPLRDGKDVCQCVIQVTVEASSAAPRVELVPTEWADPSGVAMDGRGEVHIFSESYTQLAAPPSIRREAKRTKGVKKGVRQVLKQGEHGTACRNLAYGNPVPSAAPAVERKD
jgi:hypothetical protein